MEISSQWKLWLCYFTDLCIHTCEIQHLKKHYHTRLLLERYRFDVFCRLMVLIIVLHEKKLDYIEGVSSHQRDQKKEKM